MTEDATTESSCHRSLVTWIFWPFLIIFVLYPLSVGPAVHLYRKGILPFEAIVIYRPLLNLCDRSDIAGPLVHWYIDDLWDNP